MSKRTDIVDQLIVNLRQIEKDAAVGGSGILYENTVRAVTLGEVVADDLDQNQFPAIQVVPDLPTTFEEGASGESYLAEWRLAIKLYVRVEEVNIVHEENATWRLLESLYRDVEYAIHDGDFQLEIGPDVSFVLESFDPVAPADELIGYGAVILRVNYVRVVETTA